MPRKGGWNKALAPWLTLNDFTSELPVMTHWLLPSIATSAPGPNGGGFTLPVSTVLSVRSTVAWLAGSAKISPNRLAWLALNSTTVSAGGSRTRSSAVFPVTVAPLSTVMSAAPFRTWTASPNTEMRFPPTTLIELGAPTVPRVDTMPWRNAVRLELERVSLALLSTSAPLPFELRMSLLVTVILLPGPDTNNPLAPGPFALIFEFRSAIVPGPKGPVTAATPSAVFSRIPSPPEVVTLAPLPTMLPPLKAKRP